MRLTRRGVLQAGALLPWAGGARAAPTSRLVPLDLLLTECMLTLQLQPAAMANIPLYQRLVMLPEVPGGVPELGPQLEPNLELLQSLRPDGILAPNWQRASLHRLERIAPVSWLPTFAPDGRPLEHAARLLLQIGALTGREALARDWVARAEPAFTDATERLAAHTTRPVFAIRFMEGGRHMAVFAGNGMVGAVMARLGLRNAWQGRTNIAGAASAGVEALAQVPDARIIHFDRGAETARALARLAESPFWQALPAVQAGRVQAMPVIYPSGGVFSAIRFAGQLAEHLPHG